VNAEDATRTPLNDDPRRAASAFDIVDVVVVVVVVVHAHGAVIARGVATRCAARAELPRISSGCTERAFTGSSSSRCASTSAPFRVRDSLDTRTAVAVGGPISFSGAFYTKVFHP
tara:strand:- start:33 stop:377 length:345 start_codon:yes stop_codon:yes gene_type:complete